MVWKLFDLPRSVKNWLEVKYVQMALNVIGLVWKIFDLGSQDGLSLKSCRYWMSWKLNVSASHNWIWIRYIGSVYCKMLIKSRKTKCVMLSITTYHSGSYLEDKTTSTCAMQIYVSLCCLPNVIVNIQIDIPDLTIMS